MEATPGNPNAPEHRLRRATQHRMWAGVAGGLARYFDLDPTLVRLFWVIATMATAGLALVVYLALWFIMPRDDEAGMADPWPEEPAWTGEWARGGYGSERRRRLGGIVLVVIGAILLAKQLGIFYWLNWNWIWPLVLIGLGAAMLFRQRDWRR
ncbi:MAG: PspC domain-containing protein [Chloroflexota bacterium]